MRFFRVSAIALGWIVAAATLTLVGCGGGNGSDGATVTFQEGNTPSTTQASIQELMNTFAATLSGAQEVPQRVTSALGSGTIVVNPATREMVATLTTKGITGTAAHIHQAPTGVNGPIIFPLTETSAGSGTWTTKATLTEAQFTTMRAGGFYFNVHSARFADGEIRGQITSQELSSAATAGGTGINTEITPLTAFVSALRGTQEVPPNASTAQGAGAILTTPFTREVIASVITSGITGTAAHIHEGALGVNGPILVPLNEVSPGSGIWTGSAMLTDAQFNALHAGNMYFNVHSVAFPAGEIRGQIILQRQTLANSIGPAPDSTGTGTGTGTIPGGTTGMGTDTSGASLTPVPSSTTTGTLTNPGVIIPPPSGTASFEMGF